MKQRFKCLAERNEELARVTKEVPDFLNEEKDKVAMYEKTFIVSGEEFKFAVTCSLSTVLVKFKAISIRFIFLYLVRLRFVICFEQQSALFPVNGLSKVQS